MSDVIISIKNISFAYDKHVIYNQFSVDINKNDIFFIMGNNGCGKTTLLKILCSFLQTKGGEVLIAGKKQNEYDSKALSRVIAYVPQIINMSTDFLVKDYLAMGRTPYKGFCASLDREDYGLVEKYATELEICDLLDKEFNTLSGGQKQIVAICRALVQETPIIIMDEPMSALDLGKQAEFLSLMVELKEKGKTIILTSHNPNHAIAVKEKCTICFIHEQRILGLGDCADVLCENNIRTVYGEKVLIDTKTGNILFNVV